MKERVRVNKTSAGDEKNLAEKTSAAKRSFSRRHDDLENRPQKNPFLIPFFLIFTFACIEFYAGLWTQSLALLGDAWHMFSDVLALSLAMAAHGVIQANLQPSHDANASDQKNVSKAEIVVSSINAILMLGVISWIVIEAIERFNHPQPILGSYVMVVALIGFVVNLIVAQHLHRHVHEHDDMDNLNHRAAMLHVVGDVMGSVAALIAGGVVFFTGWLPIDPILSIFIAVLLLVSTLFLLKDIWFAYRHNQ